MKYCLSKSLIMFAMAILAINIPVLLAAEQDDSGAGKMNIEKVVEMCEDQYNESVYPDADERNKLIDQCIEENSTGQESSGAPE